MKLRNKRNKRNVLIKIIEEEEKRIKKDERWIDEWIKGNFKRNVKENKMILDKVGISEEVEDSMNDEKKWKSLYGKMGNLRLEMKKKEIIEDMREGIKRKKRGRRKISVKGNDKIEENKKLKD